MINELKEDLKKIMELMIEFNKKYNAKNLSSYTINNNGYIIVYDKNDRIIADISYFEDGTTDFSFLKNKK